MRIIGTNSFRGCRAGELFRHGWRRMAMHLPLLLSLLFLLSPIGVNRAEAAGTFTLGVSPGVPLVGAITLPPATVPSGSSYTFVVFMASGYQIATLTDNGTPIPAAVGATGVYYYTVSNITANHFVTASYETGSGQPLPGETVDTGVTFYRTGQTATLLASGKILTAGGGGSAAAHLYDPASNTWSAAGSMGTGRGGHTATLLPNGKVLVAGGGSASAELYDPSTDTWSAAGNMATLRSCHTATLLAGGKVLVAGGDNRGNLLSSAELYDPAANSWSSAGSMSGNRENHTATLLPNGKVLVAGGFLDYPGSGPGTGFSYVLSVASAALYDPATNSWSVAASMQHSRVDFTATLLASGKVLVVGGDGNIAGQSLSLPSAELYDPATDTWSAAGSMTVNRQQHSATLLPSGKVLVAAGGSYYYAYNPDIDPSAYGLMTYPSSTELYDPVTNSWSVAKRLNRAYVNPTSTLLPNGKTLIIGSSQGELYDSATDGWSTAASLNTGRSGQTETLLPDGRILVTGGRNGITSPLASAELYDPATDAWSSAGSMATARMGHTATLLPNGKVLVAGGYKTSNAYFATSELYDPATNTWSATGWLNSARYNHTATLLPNGKVLVVGGYYENWMTTGILAELYDPVTGRWSTSNISNPSTSFLTATLLPNGKVLFVSPGFGYAKIYDPVTDRLYSAGNAPAVRDGFTATLLPSGKVLIAGGIIGTNVTAAAQLYDPATNSWSAAGSMTAPREYHAAMLLANGKVLVTGGYDGTNYLTAAELYDPAANSWSVAGSMAAPRENHAAMLLLNGKALMTGGYDGASYLASAELYDSSLGFSDSRRPVITGITVQGAQLSIAGTGFRSDSEGSGGTAGNSSTAYPLVKLQRLDNDQSMFLLSDPGTDWSDTSFSSAAFNGLPAGQYRVSVIANAVPSLAQLIMLAPASAVAPALLNFGAVTIGNSSSPQAVTLTNNGSADRAVVAKFSGSDAAMFSIVPGGSCGPVLAPGMSCTVNIAFAPTARGNKNAALTPSADGLDPVDLSGYGMPLTTLNLTIGGAGSGEVSLSTGGSYTSSVSQPITYYSSVTLTASPGANSVFSGWSGDCTGTGACTLTMVADKNVTATFTSSGYPLDLTISGGGTVSFSTGGSFTGSTSQTFASGTAVTLTPLANGGSIFTGWTGCDSVAGNACSVTMTAGKSVAAYFAVSATPTITAAAGTNGSISPAGTIAPAGSSQTYTITPNAGYHVDTLSVDGVLQTPATSYTFSNIQGNHTITATFAANQPYTITVTQAANGSIAPGTTTLLGGLSQTFAITPASNYRIADVLVDGKSVGAVTSYGFNAIDKDHTITASFMFDIFTITAGVTATGGGSISPAGSVTVSGGSSQSYTVTAYAGYKINYVAVNGASVGAVTSPYTYTFTNVRADASITADFVPITYTINSSAGTNGAIAPTGINTYNTGSNQPYGITPNPGYHIADVQVDGQSVGAVASYLFNNIQGNHTITASFSANPTYTITATAGANGGISPAGATPLLGGLSQTYTITPNSGYRVNQVLVDNVNVGAVTSYSFNTVNADHTISASFVQNGYTITAGTTSTNGSISPSGATIVSAGGSQNYTITANPGYKINYVAVNGASVGAVTSYAFKNVNANATITADFVPITYTITATQTANGYITPYTFNGYKAGVNQAFTIAPKTGYKIATLTVDGVSQPIATSYTFTNIRANHSITATFLIGP
jgi:hypothetical protein